MKPTTIALIVLTLLFLTTSVFAIQILSSTTKAHTAENITDCRPTCLNKNSNLEGWYYSCNKSAIKYTQCKYCTVSCMNVLNFFEGWYDTCTGLPIVFTDCNKTIKNPTQKNEAVTTTTQATTTIVTTTKATTTTTLPKCAPVCIKKTPYLKGWFNYCTKQLIKEASCTHCSLIYKEENGVAGWYDGCNSRLITTIGTVITTTTTTTVQTTKSTAPSTTFNSQTSSMRSSLVSSAVSSALSRIASSAAAK